MKFLIFNFLFFLSISSTFSWEGDERKVYRILNCSDINTTSVVGTIFKRGNQDFASFFLLPFRIIGNSYLLNDNPISVDLISNVITLSFHKYCESTLKAPVSSVSPDDQNISHSIDLKSTSFTYLFLILGSLLLIVITVLVERLFCRKEIKCSVASPLNEAQIEELIATRTLELMHHEKVCHTVFEQTTQLMVVLNMDGQIIELNRAAVVFANVAKEDLFGMYFWDCPWSKHSMDLQNKLHEMYKLAVKGKSIMFESTYPTPMGETWIVKNTISPVYDDDGSIMYLLAIGNNVTEARLVSQTIRDSEIRLHTILNTVQTGIVIVDPTDFSIVQVNQAAIQMLGTVEEQIVGECCQNFICPSRTGECPVVDLGLTVHNAERILLCADGTKLPIMKNVTEIMLDGRKLLLESFVDISDQKEQEKKLIESEQQLQKVFDSAPILMILVDADCCIRKVNRIGCDFCRKVEKEILGVPCGVMVNCTTVLVDGDICGEGETCGSCSVRSAVAETFETGLNIYQREGHLHILVDGKKEIPRLIISTTLLNQNGENFVLVCVDDVTERYQYEALNAMLLDSAGEGIFGVDCSGLLSFANPAACQMLGYSVDELIGRDVCDIINYTHKNRGDNPICDCHISKVLREGLEFQADNEVLCIKVV